MGEQGAKSLRGGNMADVIFAGTSSRPPLGRAEVSLTIDNSGVTLPIDYTEVTISRTLFRNGGSEYAINGTPCRLLDIQELLSDTGMGREMHVIVGQGQLDTVLSATPEGRRAFIEEAAGVLKHRRRKEKALRKLQGMEANLARLTALVGEIRRQLGPLARQAEVARKAHIVQSELRDAKARLLADDLVQMIANLASERADEEALRARRAQVEAAAEATRSRLAHLEAEAARSAPHINEAAETWFRLSSVRERLRGTATLAEERSRLLATAPPPDRPQRDPDELEHQAAKTRQAETDLRAELQQAAEALAGAIEERQGREAAAAEAEHRLSAVHRGLADRRESLAKLTGRVSATRSRVEALEAEIQRLRATHAEARARAEAAQEEYRALEQRAVGAETGEEERKRAHEVALVALDAAEARVASLMETQAAATTDLAAWRARREALDLTLTRQDATGALLQEGAPGGILGALATDLTVAPGYENAIAAALGHWADAAVADSIEVAADALRHSRTTEAGIAAVVVAGGEAPDPPSPPAVGTWARDLVTAAPRVRPAVERMLTGVVVVDTLAAAREAAAAGLTAVSADGDLLAPTHARGGQAGGPSTLELHAARDEAEAKIAEATAALARLEADLAPAREALQVAQTEVTGALAAVEESGSHLAQVSRRLAELGATARSSTSEAERAAEAIESAQATREGAAAELAALTHRLEAQRRGPEEGGDIPPATAARDAAAAAASAARGAETEARLALRTLEERARAIAGRAESLERAARTERQARAAAEQRAQERARQARRAAAVADGAARALAALEASLAQAQTLREQREEERRVREEEISQVRARAADLAKEHAELTDVVHADEVARAAAQAKIEQLQDKAVDELGLDPEVLIAEYGPEIMVPVLDGEDHHE